MTKKDNAPDDLVLPILKEIQSGLSSLKKEMRKEIGSVRAEMGLVHQQLATMNGMLSHYRNEFGRLEDRIARLEAHTGIDDRPQH